MSRLLGCLIAAALVAAFSWPLPVLAHVPEIGDRGWFTTLCRESADKELMELAQTKGLSRVKWKLGRFLNSGKCYVELPPAPGRIIAVVGPVYTPNGRFALYSLKVQIEVDGPPETWFAAHSMPVENEPL